ncbi:DUF935 domain-containing protein [Bowmanella denitrificans]|uniref:DUF935 domain-containing protein n=1 Tax=Bowmanella denitrificans TaxID=366582 RepID=UPI000C9C0EBC|nr:DUF935 domain-containing protein [Bowmanella denitrificans]
MPLYETNGTRFKVRDKFAPSQSQTERSPATMVLKRERPEHPSSGLTPQKLHAILTEAEHGNLIQQAYLAEDIEEKDGHIQAELFKRRMAVSSVPWMVEPPTNASAQERKDAEEIEQILKDMDEWHSLLFGMTDAVLKGISNTEMVWQPYHNWRIPSILGHRPLTWFQLHQEDQNQIVLRDNSGHGQLLQPFGWIQHRHQAKSGYPARIGLVRQLAWPFVFKNYSLRDLAEFLEIYGIPIRVGRYPSGATDQEKRALLRAVVEVGHNAGGIIPKGMELEFHDAAKGGGGDPFMTMMTWCERVQSKAIVGQTLTAQVDSTGSQALGNVHNEVRQDIRDHDLSQIASTLNRDLIWPLFMLNGKSYKGDTRRKPRLVFDIQEPEDLTTYATALPALVGMGMQIPLSYAHEKLRIPQPDGNEPILSLASKPAPDQPEQEQSSTKPLPPQGKDALRLMLAALKANQANNADQQLDNLTTQLRQQAAQPMEAWLKGAQQKVDQADSLEQLLQSLLDLEGELSETELAEAMQLALASADLAGRYDVKRGQ